MATATPPRRTLARNLKALMNAQGMTGADVARVSGVDKKTISNLLNERFDPQLDKVEAVTRVFGLTGWQLIMPGAADNVIRDGKLQEIVESYSLTDEAGRDSIAKVAEIAARPYRK